MFLLTGTYPWGLFGDPQPARVFPGARVRPAGPGSAGPCAAAAGGPAGLRPARAGSAGVRPARARPGWLCGRANRPAGLRPARAGPARLRPARAGPAWLCGRANRPAGLRPARAGPAWVRAACPGPAWLRPARAAAARVWRGGPGYELAGSRRRVTRGRATQRRAATHSQPAAGYGPPGAPVRWLGGDQPWRLVLSSTAKGLLALFLALGAVLFTVVYLVAIGNRGYQLQRGNHGEPGRGGLLGRDLVFTS